MGLRRHKQDEANGPKWLEVDATMTGTLTFKDPVNLQIKGKFEGSLETRGNLQIGEHADVRATIKGETVTVAGTVIGNLTATSRLELLASARVTGKVASPRVVVHEGAMLHGSVEMAGWQEPDGQWMTVDTLARFLEVDATTVTQWAQQGRLPAQRDNQQWKFERSKIEEWLAHERIK